MACHPSAIIIVIDYTVSEIILYNLLMEIPRLTLYHVTFEFNGVLK